MYSHAGLFVLPSFYEGLPIVLLEAMSYGLSCIASDIPANRNIDLAEERFFAPGHAQALSQKIAQWMDRPLTDDQRRKQLQMIDEKYNWENIADRTLEVYKRVGSAPGGRSS